jgi:hypothetical protein
LAFFKQSTVLCFNFYRRAWNKETLPKQTSHTWLKQGCIHRTRVGHETIQQSLLAIVSIVVITNLMANAKALH